MLYFLSKYWKHILLILAIGFIVYIFYQYKFLKDNRRINEEVIRELVKSQIDSFNLEVNLTRKQAESLLEETEENHNIKPKRVVEVKRIEHHFYHRDTVKIKTQSPVIANDSIYHISYSQKIEGLEVSGYMKSKDKQTKNYFTNVSYKSDEEVVRYKGRRKGKFLFFRVGPREIKEVRKSSSGKTTIKTYHIFRNEKQRLKYLSK